MIPMSNISTLKNLQKDVLLETSYLNKHFILISKAYASVFQEQVDLLSIYYSILVRLVFKLCLSIYYLLMFYVMMSRQFIDVTNETLDFSSVEHSIISS